MSSPATAAVSIISSPRCSSSPRRVTAAVPVDATFGPAHVHVVRGERTLAGEPGELLSLVALNGPAEGVTTEGLAYPLVGETLEPGSSRGVSNVFTAETARRARRAWRAARDPPGPGGET